MSSFLKFGTSFCFSYFLSLPFSFLPSHFRPITMITIISRTCRKRYVNFIPCYLRNWTRIMHSEMCRRRLLDPIVKLRYMRSRGGFPYMAHLAGCQIKCLFLLRPSWYVWDSRPGPDKHARSLRASVRLSVV